MIKKSAIGLSVLNYKRKSGGKQETGGDPPRGVLETGERRGADTQWGGELLLTHCHLCVRILFTLLVILMIGTQP